jgi:biotin carboxyl carrier protein
VSAPRCNCTTADRTTACASTAPARAPTGSRVAAIVECTVDRIGDFESRITCNGRKHRVVAIEQGAQIRLEVDGVAHSLSREDGLVVRTGWPALVSSLLVAPGDTVIAGQPLAVLESMKMVSTVTSPFDGVVTSLAVTNNTQVERGAALMRIKAAAQHSPAQQIPLEGDAGSRSPRVMARSTSGRWRDQWHPRGQGRLLGARSARRLPAGV